MSSIRGGIEHAIGGRKRACFSGRRAGAADETKCPCSPVAWNRRGRAEAKRGCEQLGPPCPLRSGGSQMEQSLHGRRRPARNVANLWGLVRDAKRSAADADFLVPSADFVIASEPVLDSNLAACSGLLSGGQKRKSVTFLAVFRTFIANWLLLNLSAPFARGLRKWFNSPNS